MMGIWTIALATLPSTLAIVMLFAMLVWQNNVGAKTMAVPVRVKEEGWNQVALLSKNVR